MSWRHPAVPTPQKIVQAVQIAVYTAVMTYCAALIGIGINLDNEENWKLAVKAGIAAGLAFLGWASFGADLIHGRSEWHTKPDIAEQPTNKGQTP